MSTPIKNNTVDLQRVLDMVNSLPDAGGGSVADPIIEPLEVTENGTYTTPAGVDGYSPVTVNVPIPDGYIVPSGELEIADNGAYDVMEYASVKVDVSTGEDVTEETNEYTDKLAVLETAIAGLEAELQGKAAGGGSGESFKTCSVTVVVPEDVDEAGFDALYCRMNPNENLSPIQYSDSITKTFEHVLCNSEIIIWPWSGTIVSAESVDGTSYIIDSEKVFIGSDTTIRLEVI